MNSSSEESKNNARAKNRRFKIEFYPSIVASALIGIIVYLLFDNRGYWDMFNGIIAGTVGFDADFISILLVVLFTILGLCIATVLFGLFRKLHWAHNPVLHTIPLILIIIVDTILLFAFQISDRIGLDYIYFSLGPRRAEALYFGVSIAIFMFLLIAIFSLKILYRSPEIVEREGKKIRYHPKYTTYSTSFSIIFSVPLFLMLLFDYANTGVYWDNIGVIIKRFVDWNPISIIAFLLGIICVILSQISLNSLRFSEKSKKLMKLAGILLQILALGYWAFSVEKQTTPFYQFLSIPILAIGFVALVSQFPKTLSKGITRLAEISFLKEKRFAKATIIIILLFIPYSMIFYYPLISGPPGVDSPSIASLRSINVIDVPFQGDIAYPSFELQSNETRKYIDLTGEWKYWKGTDSDPYSSAPRTDATIVKLTQGQHLPSFDDSNWQTVKVPHTISFYEDETHYWGIVWYRKTIIIDESLSNMDLLMKFLGVNYYCDLWIDGHWIGFHEGMYTAFAFDVTDYLTPGTHLLAIRVDHPAWGRNEFQNRIVPDGFDLFNHGGIEREIFIEATPRLSVVRADFKNPKIQTINHKNGSAQADITIVIKNSLDSSNTHEIQLILGIYPIHFPDIDSMSDIRTWNYIQWNQNASPIISTAFQFNQISLGKYAAVNMSVSLPFIHLWSTKSPNLYAININLSIPGNSTLDIFYSQIGFRNFSVDGNRLLLNGAPLKLAGVSIHEQYPAPIARMLNDTLRFSDLLKIKDLNANWWRAHYPLHPHSYIFSDRLGLACWEEAPINWVNEADFVQMYSRNYFYGLWIEILYRDYNRPCVFIWGATNEPWAQAGLYRYLKDLRLWMNLQDPSRYVSFAAVSSHDSWTKGFQHIEICTPNTYAGTFEGNKTDWYNELTKQLWRVANNTYNKGKPIISMEFGYWRGGINDSDQVKCFTEAYRAFTEHPNVQGMTWWIFADYHGSNYYNAMGVYNHDRSWKSPLYPVMQSKYEEFTSENL